MIQGTFAPEFKPVAEALEAQLRRLDPSIAGGAAVCVYHYGQPVVDVWGGAMDAVGRPWQRDTAALSFSTSKGVLAMLVHRLVEQGFLNYEDPVARHWPEFAQAGKELVTIRELLSHHAGLHAIRPLIRHADEMLNWRTMTEALAAAAPRVDWAGRPSYHALTYGWLVGELVRRVTSGTVNDALQAELVLPLGLDGAYFGAPMEQRHRVAMLIAPAALEEMSPITQAGRSLAKLAFRATWALLGLDLTQARDALHPRGGSDIYYSSQILDAEVPAMNGVFTARSLARIYAVLAGGGVLDGRRFLSNSTLAHATRIQSTKRDLVIGLPMQWRLGFHSAGARFGTLRHAFGHFGYGGSGAWADPARQLAIALTLNRIAATPITDGRILRIGALAARCADAARKSRKPRERDAERFTIS